MLIAVPRRISDSNPISVIDLERRFGRPRNLITLTLISRSYCHLCHEMELALVPLVAELGIEVKILDVDADSECEALYGDLVPVLLHNGVDLCHHFLDATKVRDYLGKIR